jgi:putative colanic acid biosynthesis UDP-glucose lipid carrier transferase
MITINQNQSYSLKGIRRKDFRTYINDKKFFLICKRLFDVIISLSIIVFFLSWIIPVLGMTIKLNSRGPVFFVQRRVGRGLKSFGCIKFRTMRMNNEADRSSAVENDHRITSIGKFLRKTSLDELPQFINVLKGDMSIIGPRPHMFADCNRFSEQIQYYKFRTLVRPGITGLAQVKGFRGPAESTYSIASRFSYDSLYIKHMSFNLDVNILLSTVLQTFNSIFFRSKVAERFKKWKKEKEEKKIAA